MGGKTSAGSAPSNRQGREPNAGASPAFSRPRPCRYRTQTLANWQAVSRVLARMAVVSVQKPLSDCPGDRFLTQDGSPKPSRTGHDPGRKPIYGV